MKTSEYATLRAVEFTNGTKKYIIFNANLLPEKLQQKMFSHTNITRKAYISEYWYKILIEAEQTYPGILKEFNIKLA